MNVKSLKIVGFKSFFNETQVSFHPGLNAIVGPNGCGKSNISDAIKWVMGEHNARNLRGERMEDVIFNGTHDRKPLGMAEVTMTIENNGSAMPPKYNDFTELEITRRVYRSGEGEYFINRQPCLLKDIKEIFMDSGLNPRAYAIIEQGAISDIVQSSPQDLRKLIEEAAGVTKYRERRAATQRKLQSTRENLARVQDIVAEVKRQLNAIRRQAAEARRYLAHQEELKQVDAALFCRLYRDLQERHARCAEDHARASRDADGSRHAITVIEARVEEGRTRLLESEKTVNAAQESFYRASGRAEVAENEIKFLKERVVNLQGERERAEREARETADRLGTVRGTLLSARTEAAEISAEAGRMAPELEESAKIRAAGEHELRELKERLQEARRLLDETLWEKTTLQETLTAAEQRLAGDDGLMQQSTTELKLLGEQEVALAAERDAVESRLGACLETLARLGEELAALGEDERGLRTEARAAAEAVEADVRRLAEAESRLDSLRGVQKRGDDLREGAKQLLTLASRGGQKGLVGVLGHLVTVDDDHRKAVEALLTDRLETVLVADGATAWQLAGELRDQGAGGAVVAAVDGDIPEPRATKLPPYVIGPAAAFVQAKEPAVTALVNAILRDVFIVPTLDEARRAGLAHPELTFCTLDGDIRYPWGGLAVGSGNPPSHAGILETGRRIRRSDAQVTDVRASLAREEAVLAAVKGRLDVLHARHEELASRKQDEERDVNALRLESQRLAGALSDAGRRRTAIEERLGHRRWERERDLAEQESSRGRLREIDAREAAQTLGCRLAEVDLVSRETAHAELLEQISVRQVDAAAAAERLRSAQERALRLESDLRELGERTERLDETLADLGRRSTEATGLIVEKERLLDEMRVASRTSNEDLGRLQAAHRALAEAQTAAEEELKKTRREAETLGERLAAANVELAETRTRMEETLDRAVAETGIRVNEEWPSELAELIGGELDLAARARELREKMARIGPVNLAAVEEMREAEERLTFLSTQKEDLDRAVESLEEAIRRINKTSRERFRETFELVAEKFGSFFRALFNGGEAYIALEENVDLLEAGVIVYAQPPGKKMAKLSLLSGGERAMTALGLVFALFSVRPAPFCLMDEVDAPLDDVNIERFVNVLVENNQGTQMVLITHSKRTMEKADNLVGVTMESPGVSKLISVRLTSDN